MDLIKRSMSDEVAIGLKVAGNGFDKLRGIRDMLEYIKTYNNVIRLFWYLIWFTQDVYILRKIGEEYFCKCQCISRSFEICYVVTCPG